MVKLLIDPSLFPPSPESLSVKTTEQNAPLQLMPASAYSNAYPSASLAPFVEMRLHLLRLAIDTLPRISNGSRTEDVVARARALELYVLGPPSGSEGQPSSDPADRGTGAPGTAPDAGPADLRHDGPEIGGER